MTRDLKSSRSPERQKLAEAIERRASAAQALARADEAYNRLSGEFLIALDLSSRRLKKRWKKRATVSPKQSLPLPLASR